MGGRSRIPSCMARLAVVRDGRDHRVGEGVPSDAPGRAVGHTTRPRCRRGCRTSDRCETAHRPPDAPILASAQLLGVEPATADFLPRGQSEVELAAWAEAVQLPSDPLFLDFESADGMPVSWEADTWPRPFRLRGALCWRADVGLCVIPFGSVGGMHPWGGTDYQPWARWIFTAASEPQVWPPPGPGDFFADATGDATGWVDLANESICGHQGRVAFNLVQRALSILMVLDRLGVPLVERPLLAPGTPTSSARRRPHRPRPGWTADARRGGARTRPFGTTNQFWLQRMHVRSPARTRDSTRRTGSGTKPSAPTPSRTYS